MRFLLIVPALALSSPAHAEISQQFSRMYCGPLKEVQAAVPTARPTFRAAQGSAKPGTAEIWQSDDKTDWYIVQIVPGQDMVCIVLGGSGEFQPVKSGQDT